MTEQTVPIIATCRFRHRRDTYEAGEPYDVAPEDAGYFKGVGWALSPEDYAAAVASGAITAPEATGEPTPIEVHDSRVAVTDEEA